MDCSKNHSSDLISFVSGWDFIIYTNVSIQYTFHLLCSYPVVIFF